MPLNSFQYWRSYFSFPPTPSSFPPLCPFTLQTPGRHGSVPQRLQLGAHTVGRHEGLALPYSIVTTAKTNSSLVGEADKGLGRRNSCFSLSRADAAQLRPKRPVVRIDTSWKTDWVQIRDESFCQTTEILNFNGVSNWLSSSFYFYLYFFAPARGCGRDLLSSVIQEYNLCLSEGLTKLQALLLLCPVLENKAHLQLCTCGCKL